MRQYQQPSSHTRSTAPATAPATITEDRAVALSHSVQHTQSLVHSQQRELARLRSELDSLREWVVSTLRSR